MCIKKIKTKIKRGDGQDYFKDNCQLAKAERETKVVTDLDMAKGRKAQKLRQNR